MKFTLPKIKKLIEQSKTMGDIGHPLMDECYKWYQDLVGHPNPYYKLFYLLSKEFKPGFVVELGSYRATASGHLAVGHSQSIVVAIDIHKDMPQQQPDKDAAQFAAQAIPNLFYINKWSIPSPAKIYGGQNAVSDIAAYNRQIDILFIDAWHKDEYVKEEWELYSPLLADEALVICDDVFNNVGNFAGMEEWWADFKYDKFLNSEVHPGVPMGFMKFERKNVKSKTTTKKTSTTRKTTQAAKK